MEKLIMEIGLVIFFFFSVCALVIGSQFITGAFIGMGVTAFGWYFWDD